jgi:hypothetical protein
LTLSNTVPNPIDPTGDVYGWDWTATTHDGRVGVVDDLVSAVGPSLVLPGKGIHGWSQSLQCFDNDGYQIGAVYFGSREDVHVLATGESAQWVRSATAALDGARTSRVDTRVDTLAEWDDLQAICWDAAESYGSQITTMETHNGPRQGRTIYLGAPSSAIRVRIYEKWRESPGQYVDGTNRVEVQLRPASKVKERVSGWTPAETFCASRVTTSLAAALGQDASVAGSLHVKRDTPTLEQALRSMGDQYGKAAARWLELSAGDVGKILDYLVPDAAPGASQGPSRLPTAVDRLERVELPPTDLSVSGGRAGDGSSWPDLNV